MLRNRNCGVWVKNKLAPQLTPRKFLKKFRNLHIWQIHLTVVEALYRPWFWGVDSPSTNALSKTNISGWFHQKIWLCYLRKEAYCMCIDKNTVFPYSLTNQADSMQAASDDDVLAASSKLMQRNKHVYEELAGWKRWPSIRFWCLPLHCAVIWKICLKR